MRLPADLENYIFNEMGAKYEPNPRTVTINYFNTEEQWKIYLGTYFTRSYCEGYNTIKILLSNNVIRQIYKRIDPINIVDIGAGNGGYAFGIVDALLQMSSDIKINLYSIEGNQLAIDQQNKIYDAIYNEKIRLTPINSTVSILKGRFGNDLNNYLDDIINSHNINGFDLIVTSKFISEFYKKRSGLSYGNALLYDDGDGLYKEFIKSGNKYLNDKGFIIINDVPIPISTKNNDIIFINQIISLELHDNNSNGRLQTIIPLSCAHHWQRCICNGCYKGCYQCKSFELEQPDNNGEIFSNTRPTVIRILCAKDLASDILTANPPENRYKIAYWLKGNERRKRYCEIGRYIKDDLCPEQYPDAYEME